MHAFAAGRGLTVRTPLNFKDPADVAAFEDLGLDAAVVVAYGLILPKAVLDAPRLGCLNIHASLLPRWRGAAPIQRAIQAGDAESGVTIMQMDEGLDTGDMLMRGDVPLGGGITAGVLHDELSALGAKLVVEALEALAAGEAAPTPQPDDGVTYAHKLTKHEARLDWSRPADELARTVRAFDPWPGTWFENGKDRIKVLSAVPETAADGPNTAAPGTVLDDRGLIACGQGALRLMRVQRAGKAPADADAFFRGYALPVGTVL